MKRAIFILTAMIIILAYASKTEALMLEISLEELVNEAEVIIEGRVNKMWSAWSDDRSLIYTYVVVEITDLLKGEKQLSKELTFRFRGGEVDGIGMAESDMPSFSEKEEVVLFLEKDKSKYFQLSGNFQGKFKIEEDKLTHRKIVTQKGYSVAKRVGSKLVLDKEARGRVFLPRFKQIIKDIIKQPAAK